MTINMLIVMLITIAVILLFIIEPIRLDLIAISIPFILVLLQPWTRITTDEALSGFSNPATITILAMFVLSRGIYKSGVVQIMGDKIIQLTGNNEKRQLLVTTSLSGLTAGVINNTPLVAILIPMITELARKTKTSPSRLLIPISYASMLGGMLTLFGTSTNIIASELSERLLGQAFSIFEFTHIGIILLVVGIIYIVFFSRYLIPERITSNIQLTEEYEMSKFLTQVKINKNCSLIGKKAKNISSHSKLDLNIVQLIRENKKYIEPYEKLVIKEGDHLIVRTDQKTLIKFIENQGLEILPEINVTRKHLEKNTANQKLIEIVIPHGSKYEGENLAKMDFLQRYRTTLLAIRQSGRLSHMEMVLTGCIKPGEIYEAVNWEIIFILAGLIPLGISMEKTGAASFLAEKIVSVSSNYSPLLTMILFYMLTAVLTNIISNNASAILMIPVAVNTASNLGVNPFAFILIVTFAASSAFLTPIGYQTNLMVYGPGGYYFRDFLKVGAPLQLIMSILTPILIYIFWGF